MSLILHAQTVQDLMTPEPLTILSQATLQEAAALMTDARIGALPVLNTEGFPVGIVTRSDIVRYEREHSSYCVGQLEPTMITLGDDKGVGRSLHIESGSFIAVEELMTPWLWTVYPDTPLKEAIDLMLAKQIHHLCVTDKFGYVVGMVSTMDILINLA